MYYVIAHPSDELSQLVVLGAWNTFIEAQEFMKAYEADHGTDDGLVIAKGIV